MGNYGYNPDEHYETKLTLIDKDGFQKEGNTEDIISDYNELREEIENRGIPSGGESGQMLTKVSNDDYDVEWSDIPSFTENVETAVANAANTWLQTNITNPSNPPLDSSLSLSNAAAPADKVGELKSAIEYKAPAIMNTIESAYLFDDVVSPAEINYEYSATAFGNARYANRRNYMPVKTLDTTKNNIHIVMADRTIIADGTASESSSYYVVDDVLPVSIPAGNYKFKFEVNKGLSVITYGQNIIVRAIYADGTAANLFTQLVKDADVTVDVTVAKEITKIRVEFYFTSKNTYANHRIWMGLYPADTVFTDLGKPVTDGSEVTAKIENLSTPSVVDTVQHKCGCTYLIDTKTYVDNNIPEDVVTDSDLGYFTPEMFGAKGDGVTDDTQAILDCIVASRINTDFAIPIRGYNRYRTTSSIIFSGKNNNVYLHNILYTGNDAAIILHGDQNKYSFDKIEATAQTTSVAIRITATQDEGFNQNTLYCTRILSNGNCVEFVNNTNKVIYYNVLTFCAQTSMNGNVFYINGNDINEIDLYGKVIFAVNGYFIYDTNEVPQSIIRVHNYCIESGLKYGINTRVSLIGCRTEEFFVTPGTSEDPKAGVLFDFEDKVPHGGVYADELTKIAYASVDVSGAMSYQDSVDYVASHYVPGQSAANHTLYIRYIIPIFPEFKFMSQYKLNSKPNCSMIVYYDHKAVKPKSEWYYKVSTDFNAGVQSDDYIVPTYFDIDGSSVTINLDDSYCYLAINNFKVQQYADKKAIIYDKLGNLLFNGTNKDAGVYEFECDFVKHDPITLNLTGGGTYTYPLTYSDRVYDGTNEVWHIYKKDVVV